MESEKRYGWMVVYGGSDMADVVTYKGAPLIASDVADRLNALEAERDYMSEALDVATEKYHEVVATKVALEAEREAILAIINNRNITYEQMVIELRQALGGGDDN